MSETRVRRALETLVALRRDLRPGAKLDPDALGTAWAEAEHALAADAIQPPRRDEVLREAIRDAITWHQDNRKALSKEPRADQWMMLQHQEQIDTLDAALATTTDGAGGRNG